MKLKEWSRVSVRGDPRTYRKAREMMTDQGKQRRINVDPKARMVRMTQQGGDWVRLEERSKTPKDRLDLE